MPPPLAAEYAVAHDDAMWACAVKLLDDPPGSTEQLAFAKKVATLPMRHGGLGLRSALRTRFAAYWASWADALPMITARTPTGSEGGV